MAGLQAPLPSTLNTDVSRDPVRHGTGRFYAGPPPEHVSLLSSCGGRSTAAPDRAPAVTGLVALRESSGGLTGNDGRRVKVARQGRMTWRPQAAVDVGQESSAAVANTRPSPEVLEVWRAADAVCFDVDSTVCTDEGIDELAAFCGAGEAVAAWTTRAMTGSVPFEDALAARLGLFNPSAATLASFLAQHPPRLSPGIKELVAELTAQGKDVFLVSGGFRQMIEPAAEQLGIPKDRIFANRLLFDKDGKFAGFDHLELTSRSGGKALVIEHLKQEHGYKLLVMLGDGATDLEARRPGGADIFIGFGGVQVRPKVAAGADWFVYDFEDLISALRQT